jgi:hypothetical protein
MHPELMHLDPNVASHIRDQHIAASPGLENLARTISSQGRAQVNKGWATIRVCRNDDGSILNDSHGKPIYRYTLSEQTNAALGQPTRAALKTSKDDPALKNKTYSVNHGVTSVNHSAPGALVETPDPPIRFWEARGRLRCRAEAASACAVPCGIRRSPSFGRTGWLTTLKPRWMPYQNKAL